MSDKYVKVSDIRYYKSASFPNTVVATKSEIDALAKTIEEITGTGDIKTKSTPDEGFKPMSLLVETPKKHEDSKNNYDFSTKNWYSDKKNKNKKELETEEDQKND